ncbi:MAG: dihydropteroate synthase [Verrucomicrobia bacterium]|nr:MAG: dihydropteroate synthase [Verrucomicrobiota bacterium]
MGVVNATPDSFSDGGRFLDPTRAVEAALRMVSEGADIIDIGGESTRPGAVTVAEDEEIARVVPVIRGLRAASNTPISADTRKTAVARAALETGAEIVNDVGAAQADPAMRELLRTTGAGYVCMHMQGTPATMQVEPRYDDVVASVDAFFEERLASLADAGVPVEQVVLDPGIGFGKTPGQNLALLRHLGDFERHGRPCAVGVSRKAFLGHFLGGEVMERLPGSLSCALWAVRHGTSIIRTHDVAATVKALRMQALLEGSIP